MYEEIPKNIYQTFPTNDVPKLFRENTERLIKQNIGWEYRLFNDDDIIKFIQHEYGKDMLSTYLRISDSYGAAKADLFRYLLMYKMGGVYLDIKSSLRYPLDRIISRNEEYILSNWNENSSDSFAFSGKHPELSAYEKGELQQWFIICVPKHPYLAAVIEKVVDNIRDYKPWKYGVGKFGVLRTTGPIAYTLAIEPIKNKYKHLEIASSESLGLEYNSLKGVDHTNLFTKHYTREESSVINAGGVKGLVNGTYILCRNTKHLIKRCKSVF